MLCCAGKPVVLVVGRCAEQVSGEVMSLQNDCLRRGRYTGEKEEGWEFINGRR